MIKQTIQTSKKGFRKTKKILFACVPADGHFNPLTGLAKHLQSIGYDVRWYASCRYENKLTQLNLPHYRFEKAMDIAADKLDEVFPERLQIKGAIKKLNFDLEHFFLRRGPEYFKDIREIHESFPFDLLIADSAFTGSIFVKRILEIPVIAIGVFPLAQSSKDLAPSGLGIVPSSTFIGKLKQSLLRYAVKNILLRKSNKLFHGILNRHNIEHNNAFLFDINSADYLLQSGTPGFEYYRSDLRKNTCFIGSLLPYTNHTETKPWFDERLNVYEKVILVTQGTVEKDVNKLIVPTLEAFKNTGTLVICTTGGANTQELKARYPQNNIIIEDFISFKDIMPYGDVYITNGGYGGVMLAIENKLPLVVAGIHEGKNEICARVGYFKYGINLKTEMPIPMQVYKAAEEVINNKMYKRNIEKLGNEFAGYNANLLCESYVDKLLWSANIEKNQSEMVV